MIRKNFFIVTAGFFLTTSYLHSSEVKLTQQEYISKWKETAVAQMSNYKIPASITLAQGILESGYGNSDLATKANNHFGIKCHNWTGESYFKDDDQKNECFRKYASANQSFEDHSLFLTQKSRYASLFDLPTTDYKAWANGLKDAGYASNPKYADMLIELIERFQLSAYDQASANIAVTTPSKNATNALVSKREIKKNSNDLNYIVTKKGDTYYRLAKELNININDLYKYNEFDAKKDFLEEGDIIYIQSLKRKSKNKKEIKVTEQTTLLALAHQEGILVKRLMKMNNISSPEQILKKGEKIKLK